MEFKTAEDLENERVELLKERAKADDALQEILIKIHAVDKEIADREIIKADLRESARKARHIIRGFDLQIKLKETEFWRAKHR